MLDLPPLYQKVPCPRESSAEPGSAYHWSTSSADCLHAAGAGTGGSAGRGGDCRAVEAPDSNTGAWSPAGSAGPHVPALGYTGEGLCGTKGAAGAWMAAAALASVASWVGADNTEVIFMSGGMGAVLTPGPGYLPAPACITLNCLPTRLLGPMYELTSMVTRAQFKT